MGATKGFKQSAGAEATQKKIDNPTEMFISQPERGRKSSTSTSRIVTIELKEGETLNRAVVEAKTERVQFVFRKSLLARLKAECERLNVSMNEYIHITLEKELPL